jgi:hypothetical protein
MEGYERTAPSDLPGYWRRHACIGKHKGTRETPTVVLEVQDQPVTRESQTGLFWGGGEVRSTDEAG